MLDRVKTRIAKDHIPENTVHAQEAAILRYAVGSVRIAAENRQLIWG